MAQEEYPAAVAAAKEYRQIEKKMADPAVASDPDALRKLGQRHSDLQPIVDAYRHLTRLEEDGRAARELAGDDPDLAQEAKELEAQIPGARDSLLRALIPRDPDDIRDVIMEIKAGTGGEEAALFAGDLLRMYTRYAERRGWTSEIQSMSGTSLGGVKDAQIAFHAPHPASARDGVWASLKYEGGVHRVQRIPVTDTQGRIEHPQPACMCSPRSTTTVTIPSTRRTCASSTVRGLRARAAGGVDDVLGRAHHPSAHGDRGEHAGPAQPDPEQGRPACVLRSRLFALKREQENEARRRHSRSRPRPVSASAPATPREPHRRPQDQLQGLQPRPGAAGDLSAVIDSDIQADEAEQLAQAANAR